MRLENAVSSIVAGLLLLPTGLSVVILNAANRAGVDVDTLNPNWMLPLTAFSFTVTSVGVTAGVRYIRKRVGITGTWPERGVWCYFKTVGLFAAGIVHGVTVRELMQ